MGFVRKLTPANKAGVRLLTNLIDGASLPSPTEGRGDRRRRSGLPQAVAVVGEVVVITSDP